MRSQTTDHQQSLVVRLFPERPRPLQNRPAPPHRRSSRRPPQSPSRSARSRTPRPPCRILPAHHPSPLPADRLRVSSIASPVKPSTGSSPSGYCASSYPPCILPFRVPVEHRRAGRRRVPGAPVRVQPKRRQRRIHLRLLHSGKTRFSLSSSIGNDSLGCPPPRPAALSAPQSSACPSEFQPPAMPRDLRQIATASPFGSSTTSAVPADFIAGLRDPVHLEHLRPQHHRRNQSRLDPVRRSSPLRIFSMAFFVVWRKITKKYVRRGSATARVPVAAKRIPLVSEGMCRAKVAPIQRDTNRQPRPMATATPPVQSRRPRQLVEAMNGHGGGIQCRPTAITIAVA